MINVFSVLLHQKPHIQGLPSINVILHRTSVPTNLNLFSSRVLCRQNYHDGSTRNTGNRQMPTLVYIQNPITWLINKIDFKMLRSAWDPEFDENEFKRGTKQAVAVICTLISKNLWEDLRGLVTRQTLIRLRRDVEVNWTDEQRRNIMVEPEDIKLALARKVYFLRIADQKFVDVDMMFVAMKFKDLESTMRDNLVLIELVARFHRNYTVGELPNWTVTLFKVTKFNSAVNR